MKDEKAPNSPDRHTSEREPQPTLKRVYTRGQDQWICLSGLRFRRLGGEIHLAADRCLMHTAEPAADKPG